jgi:hypothetical protein
MRAAELVVRTSCVGESLTVPVLKLSRRLAGSSLIEAALGRIVADESGHAQLGWWYLDWADDLLDDDARAHLARVAGEAVRSFAPLLASRDLRPASSTAEWQCGPIDARCTTSGLGVVSCDRYDPVFTAAVIETVAQPLAERGIEIARDDLAAVGA